VRKACRADAISTESSAAEVENAKWNHVERLELGGRGRRKLAAGGDPRPAATAWSGEIGGVARGHARQPGADGGACRS